MSPKEYKKQLLPLVKNVLPMAHRMLGCQTEAEDVVQEIMLSIWEKRRTIKIHTSHKAFLYKIVRNKCLDRLKQKQRLYLHDENKTPVTNESKTDEFDTMQWIRQCIKMLPPIQQDILNMREIDGLEFQEISKLLDLKEPHIRVLLSRAKRTLQEILPQGL